MRAQIVVVSVPVCLLRPRSSAGTENVAVRVATGMRSPLPLRGLSGRGALTGRQFHLFHRKTEGCSGFWYSSRAYHVFEKIVATTAGYEAKGLPVMLTYG